MKAFFRKLARVKKRKAIKRAVAGVVVKIGKPIAWLGASPLPRAKINCP